MRRSRAVLHIVVGLTGSGKTTLARALAAEHGQVRLNPDEWMRELGVDLFDEPFRYRLEQQMIRLAGELLRQGMSVVVEFGSWSRAERDQLLDVGRSAGARVELHVLDLELDEVWRRLSQRNLEQGEAHIDRQTLESYLPHWQRPDAEELSRYDRHVIDRGEAVTPDIGSPDEPDARAD